MKNALFAFTFLTSSILFSQGSGRIVGRVVDYTTKEALRGANIKAKIPLGTATDLHGRYSIEVPTGTYDIEFSYIGYKTLITKAVKVEANQNQSNHRDCADAIE
jgi:hypothetical protein